MEKDSKFKLFIEYLAKFANLSPVPTLVTMYIDKISTFTDKQLLEFIKPHAQSEFESLLNQICSLALIDTNQVPLVDKRKFCTYVYYFHEQLMHANAGIKSN